MGPVENEETMPTINRALTVKAGMEKGTGCPYAVYRDILHHCFRVLPQGTRRAWHHEVKS